MLKNYLKSQIDLPVYILWLLLSAFLLHVTSAVELNSFSDDDFREFDDPDDTSTIDLTDPVSSSERLKHSHTPSPKYGAVDDNDSKRPTDAAADSSVDEPEEEEEDIPLIKRKPIPVNPTELEEQVTDGETVTEVDEPDHFQLHDDEEFEGLTPSAANENQFESGGPKKKLTDLKMAKVPRHLTGSWDSYRMEMLILSSLVVYLCNFLVGRAKNTQLATAWFEAHKSLFDTQFALVGDDGQSEPSSDTLVKESEHLYSLWCSGRAGCEGMLIELRLVRRQCLLFQIVGLLQPVYDSIIVKVIMEDSEMDGWVMAVGRKRRLQALAKDHLDLAFFCPDKRGQRHPGLPDALTVLSENPEATSTMLNAPICKFLTENENAIEYLFFSDQYTGPKPSPEETPSAQLPVTQKVLIFSFRVGNKGTISTEDMESTAPLFQFIFYVVDKVRRFRLSKEFKLKSERNRQRAYETRLKSVHSLRQEAAQTRREERLRANKERILAEDDPEKAKKLEEREQRREKAKKMPKIKMLKSRGM